jgi:hypothetical protein
LSTSTRASCGAASNTSGWLGWPSAWSFAYLSGVLKITVSGTLVCVRVHRPIACMTPTSSAADVSPWWSSLPLQS